MISKNLTISSNSREREMTVACTALAKGATVARLTAGTITRAVPVTVKSNNLLSYGAISANGLTATVTDDGKLHISGQASTAHKGLEWNVPIVDDIRGRTVVFTNRGYADGLYAYIHLAGANNSDLGNIVTGQTTTVPNDVQSVKFRVAVNSTNPIDGDCLAQLNLGSTALAWMAPDDINLSDGGGYELENLWGVMPTGTQNGVTFTSQGDGSYLITGVATKETSFVSSYLRFSPGEYHVVRQMFDNYRSYFEFQDIHAQTVWRSFHPTKIIKLDEETLWKFMFRVGNGAEFDDVVVTPQLFKIYPEGILPVIEADSTSDLVEII